LADLAGLPGDGQAARTPPAHSMTPTLSYASLIREVFECVISGERLA
jgi:hypothetical protein